MTIQVFRCDLCWQEWRSDRPSGLPIRRSMEMLVADYNNGRKLSDACTEFINAAINAFDAALESRRELRSKEEPSDERAS